MGKRGDRKAAKERALNRERQRRQAGDSQRQSESGPSLRFHPNGRPDFSEEIEALTAYACPALRQVYGVGADTAATLLVALGDNPERIGSDAAFAKLCGVSPIEASSGKTVRHRLNRGGNRDANRALHVICVVRLRRHQPTRDYLARRMGEGRTKPEIMRCIKRYIAREVYHAVLPTRQEIPTQTIATT